MPLKPGTRLGPYEILSPLGAGGMGEVYRARDTKLDRHVAIKVLPDVFVTDPERVARFQREAKTLASLNHPNIGGIHGLEDVGTVTALVMELIEGENLAARIARGAIPIDEALPVARQIAEALEAAHEQGIIHRDLKPANIQVRPDGTVKVLDFGLAKVAPPVGGPAHDSQSTTFTSPAAITGLGIMLGTAAYMAPEQAKGKPASKRSDVWAFGVVLFEMLTGRAPFAGETTAVLLAAVMTAEPDWSRLPTDTPASVRRLLRRCLQRDLSMRLPDIGSARLELSEALAVNDKDPAVSRRRTLIGVSRFAGWLLIAALIGATAGSFLIWRWSANHRPEQLLRRLSLPTPQDIAWRAYERPLISPDGRHVVAVAMSKQGLSMLWIRQLDSLAFKPLAGTEGAAGPFWSPDSQSVGFFVNDQVKRVALGGGAQLIGVLDSGYAAGGTWNAEGVIVISKGQKGLGQASPGNVMLVTLSTTTGQVKPLTTLDSSRCESGHYWPQFLPDGRHIAFIADCPRDVGSEPVITSLDAPHERRPLPLGLSTVSFTSQHVLFVRANNLMTQRFDFETLSLVGEASSIAEGVDFWGVGHVGMFSVSNDGVVVYAPARSPDVQLAWVTRTGRTLSTVGRPRPYGQIALSPDEKRVAVELQDPDGQSDLWLVELATGIPRRITFNPGHDGDAVWTPDGNALIFSSSRAGPLALFRKDLASDAPESLMFETKIDLRPESWTPDGKGLLYFSEERGRKGFMWSGGGSRLILDTKFPIDELQVSPDGRLLAYMSAESGRDEVYLQRLTQPGAKVRVSAEGGGEPKWRADGKELFYLATNRMLMVAPVLPGPDVAVGLSQPLHELSEYRSGYDDYAPSRDGQRFLVKRPAESATSLPYQIIFNWSSGMSHK